MFLWKFQVGQWRPEKTGSVHLKGFKPIWSLQSVILRFNFDLAFLTKNAGAVGLTFVRSQNSEKLNFQAEIFKNFSIRASVDRPISFQKIYSLHGTLNLLRKNQLQDHKKNKRNLKKACENNSEDSKTSLKKIRAAQVFFSQIVTVQNCR